MNFKKHLFLVSSNNVIVKVKMLTMFKNKQGEHLDPGWFILVRFFKAFESKLGYEII